MGRGSRSRVRQSVFSFKSYSQSPTSRVTLYNQPTKSKTRFQTFAPPCVVTVDRTRPRTLVLKKCPPRHRRVHRETPRGLCLSCHKLPPHRSLALDVSARALSPPAATAPPRYSHGCHAGGISARLPGAVARSIRLRSFSCTSAWWRFGWCLRTMSCGESSRRGPF